MELWWPPCHHTRWQAGRWKELSTLKGNGGAAGSSSEPCPAFICLKGKEVTSPFRILWYFGLTGRRRKTWLSEDQVTGTWVACSVQTDGCPRNQCPLTFAEQERANRPVRVLGLGAHCLEGTLSRDGSNLLPTEREAQELGDLFYSSGQILQTKM